LIFDFLGVDMRLKENDQSSSSNQMSSAPTTIVDGDLLPEVRIEREKRKIFDLIFSYFRS